MDTRDLITPAVLAEAMSAYHDMHEDSESAMRAALAAVLPGLIKKYHEDSIASTSATRDNLVSSPQTEKDAAIWDAFTNEVAAIRARKG